MTAFRQSLDHGLPSGATAPAGLQVHEWGNYIKCKLFQSPMGDQACATTCDTLKFAGGFPDIPLMEDVELTKRVRKLAVAGAGRIVTFPEQAQTSVRRFLQMPVWRLGFRNQMLVLRYNILGADPVQIYRDYYGPAATAAKGG